MIALDTNLLIYAHRHATPEHAAARKAVDRAQVDSRGWGISFPSVAEFWSVVTHPATIGGPSNPLLASQFLQSLIDADMQIWLPDNHFARGLADSATRLSVVGSRIFDLQIALIAIQSGATELWTHDRNFVRLTGLRVFDPLA